MLIDHNHNKNNNRKYENAIIAVKFKNIALLQTIQFEHPNI